MYDIWQGRPFDLDIKKKGVEMENPYCSNTIFVNLGPCMTIFANVTDTSQFVSLVSSILTMMAEIRKINQQVLSSNLLLPKLIKTGE
jgi:hypothetical protein